MADLTRRQVGKAAAWSVPVVALATAAPASAASAAGDDYCACLDPASLSLDPGSWGSDALAANPAGGTHWLMTNNLHFPTCGMQDGWLIEFTNSRIDVATTQGTLNVFWHEFEGGMVHPDLGFLPVGLQFSSTAWDWHSSADHHVTKVTVHAQVHLTSGVGPGDVDEVCPAPMTFTWTLGPDQFGNWDSESGTTIASIS